MVMTIRMEAGVGKILIMRLEQTVEVYAKDWKVLKKKQLQSLQFFSLHSLPGLFAHPVKQYDIGESDHQHGGLSVASTGVHHGFLLALLQQARHR